MEIVHETALKQPVDLSWDVSGLSDEQRSTLVLVRWTPELGVWQADPTVPVSIAEGTARAQVTDFSAITWIVNIPQQVGELTGKRSSAPTCSTTPLPEWVDTVIRPDEDEPSMPIRTCVEPDKNDILTARVVNNRPYTQALDLSGTNKYAWTWSGDADYTLRGIIQDQTNAILSSDTTLVMAPTRATAVGLAQPSSDGEVRLAAHPTVGTVTQDILVGMLGSAFNLDNVSGFDSASVNALVQTVYDCGGRSVLKSRDIVDIDMFHTILETVKSCAESDEVAVAIERALRTQIAKGGESATKAVKTNRRLIGALGKLKLYLTVAEFSSYTAELISGIILGDVTLSVYSKTSPPVNKNSELRLHADGIGRFDFGAKESEVLAVLTSAWGNPETDAYVGECEGAAGLWQSNATFGDLRVRFQAGDASPSSPRTLISWDFAYRQGQNQVRLDADIPADLSLTELKAQYPDGGYLEDMGAWMVGELILIPGVPQGATTIQAGELDWCI
ncbi:MAG: hypothetical protein ACK5LN_13585 [Propioniciclava sp.]